MPTPDHPHRTVRGAGRSHRMSAFGLEDFAYHVGEGSYDRRGLGIGTRGRGRAGDLRSAGGAGCEVAIRIWRGTVWIAK
jgi:hypothetical protein